MRKARFLHLVLTKCGFMLDWSELVFLKIFQKEAKKMMIKCLIGVMSKYGSHVGEEAFTRGKEYAVKDLLITPDSLTLVCKNNFGESCRILKAKINPADLEFIHHHFDVDPDLR